MANVNDMNMKELVEAIESGTLTEAEERQARKRLDDLSTDYGSEPGGKEEFRPPKEALEPKPKEDYKKGRQYAAHGGMIHRGRRAGNSAEKAR